MKKNILITGVSGFLGRTLARHYFEQGWNVIGVDLVQSEDSPTPFLQTYLCTVLPDPSFLQLVKTTLPSVCIHCAGHASVSGSISHPNEDYKQGPALTFYVLDSLRENSPECKFILVSSAAVYGNPQVLPVTENQLPAPISTYGFHKWQSEILCQEFANIYNLQTASVRIFSAYGPGLRRQVIWDTCRKALIDKEILMRGTGNESRDFIHALDIAHGIECVLQKGSMSGDLYNLASGKEVKIIDLTQQILRSLDISKKVKFSGQNEEGDPKNWVADISKISQLGFSIENQFEKGIESFAQWCRNDLLGI